MLGGIKCIHRSCKDTMLADKFLNCSIVTWRLLMIYYSHILQLHSSWSFTDVKLRLSLSTDNLLSLAFAVARHGYYSFRHTLCPTGSRTPWVASDQEDNAWGQGANIRGTSENLGALSQTTLAHQWGAFAKRMFLSTSNNIPPVSSDIPWQEQAVQ